MKGGKRQMGRPKKVKAETQDEGFEDGYLEDLDKIKDVDQAEEEQEPQDESSEKLKELEEEILNLEKVIITNKKYIIKIWQRVKELEDHFRIFTESK